MSCAVSRSRSSSIDVLATFSVALANPDRRRSRPSLTICFHAGFGCFFGRRQALPTLRICSSVGISNRTTMSNRLGSARSSRFGWSVAAATRPSGARLFHELQRRIEHSSHFGDTAERSAMTTNSIKCVKEIEAAALRLFIEHQAQFRSSLSHDPRLQPNHQKLQRAGRRFRGHCPARPRRPREQDSPARCSAVFT